MALIGSLSHRVASLKCLDHQTWNRLGFFRPESRRATDALRMFRVGIRFDKAWRNAWRKAPVEVQAHRSMTRDGRPTTRIHKSLLPAVFGSLPSELRYQRRNKAVPDALADGLVRTVEAHAEDLIECVRLHRLFSEALRAVPVDMVAGSRRLVRDNWALIIADLWRSGAQDEEQVRMRVLNELSKPSSRVTESLEETEVVAELAALVGTHWVPASPEEPLRLPEGIEYQHNDVPEEVWEQVLDWLAPLDLASWAQSMYLVSDSTQPPEIDGPDRGTRTLDRSVKSRTVRLLSSNDARVIGECTPVEVLKREVACALAPLGLPSLEARAVLVLGFWLVAGRAFNLTYGEVKQARELSATKDGSVNNPEAEHFLRVHRAMLGRVWHTIMMGSATSGRGSDIDRPERIPGTHGLDNDSEGRRRLVDPVPTFMKRLWSRAHSYAHLAEIDARVATEILQFVWKSWVQDVGTMMKKSPHTEEVAGPVQIDTLRIEERGLTGLMKERDREILLTEQVHSLVTGSQVTHLVRGLIASDDPTALAADWLRAVAEGGLEPVEIEASGIGDPVVVRDHILKHMKQ